MLATNYLDYQIRILNQKALVDMQYKAIEKLG